MLLGNDGSDSETNKQKFETFELHVEIWETFPFHKNILLLIFFFKFKNEILEKELLRSHVCGKHRYYKDKFNGTPDKYISHVAYLHS